MERTRVRTPPILEWSVVSLPGSSEEENEMENDFPFETIASAVKKLQTIVCTEWMYQPNDGFELKRKSLGFDEQVSGISEDKNSLAYICSDIKKNLKQIVKETQEKEDYLEQFHICSSIYSELKKTKNS